MKRYVTQTYLRFLSLLSLSLFSLSLSLTLSITLYLSLSLSLSLYLIFSLSLSLYLYLFLSLYLSLSHKHLSSSFLAHTIHTFSHPLSIGMKSISVHKQLAGVVLVADPSANEEKSMDGSITFSINAHR